MKNQLQKALNLTKKTGDRIIMFDLSENMEPFVVMGLNDYEKIVIGKNEVRGLTEDELLDKINRDIAIWRSDQDNNDNDFQDDVIDYKNEDHFTPVSDIIDKRWDDFDWEEDDDFEEDMDIFEENINENKSKKNPWQIPSERKQAAEEVVDEDPQYIEKI